MGKFARGSTTNSQNTGHLHHPRKSPLGVQPQPQPQPQGATDVFFVTVGLFTFSRIL